MLLRLSDLRVSLADSFGTYNKPWHPGCGFARIKTNTAMRREAQRVQVIELTFEFGDGTAGDRQRPATVAREVGSAAVLAFQCAFFRFVLQLAPCSRARYLARCTCETCTVKRVRLSRATTALMRRRRRRNATLGMQSTRFPPLLNASPRGEAVAGPRHTSPYDGRPPATNRRTTRAADEPLRRGDSCALTRNDGVIGHHYGCNRKARADT